jgi:hypothetical protein
MAFTVGQDNANHADSVYEDDALRRDSCRDYFLNPRYLDSIDVQQNMSSASN